MTGLASIHNLHTSYNNSRTDIEGNMTRLATGDRFSKIGIVNGGGIGGNLALSERLRYRIRTGEAASVSIHNGMSYVDTADFFAQTIGDILNRLTEVSAAALSVAVNDDDRAALDLEFQSLKQEITSITRNATMFEKQTVGRDAVVTFDTDNDQITFYQGNGGDEGFISREFDATATDSNNNFIGFSETRDYTMSRDGRSLYYIGVDSGGTDFTVNKYDINSDIIEVGDTLFDATDTLHVDEAGDFYINNQGDLYMIDPTDMSSTALAVNDMAADTQFSVYNDEVTYLNTADEIVRYNLNTATSTTLIADTTTVLTAGPGFISNVFAAGGVDHAISASGQYIADEVDPGVIRVIDTATGTGNFITVGTGTAVTDIQFNEDGDRVYYIDENRNEIRFVSVETKYTNNDRIDLTQSTFAVAAGNNERRFDSLDLGGSNYNSIVPFYVAQDSNYRMEYEAADARQYALGLIGTRVDTKANASDALEDVKTAVVRLAAERAKLGAKGARFRHVLNAHMNYLASVSQAESTIRDTDIASEMSILTTNQVKNQASLSMINKYNALKESVISLLIR